MSAEFLLKVKMGVRVHRHVVNPVEEDQAIGLLVEHEGFNFGELAVVGGIQEGAGKGRSYVESSLHNSWS
jgi:hypothetical protein